MPRHPFIGGNLIGFASVLAIYSAFMVIWRHNSAFTPGRNVYLFTGLLLVTAILLCHSACAEQEEN